MKKSVFCKSFPDSDVVWRSIVDERNIQLEPIYLRELFLSRFQNFTVSTNNLSFIMFTKFSEKLAFLTP